MAGDNPEIKLKFKISPLVEMKKDRQDFVKKHPDLKKKFQPWDIDEKIAANPRKWNEKKLTELLRAIARYDLKLLDVRVGQSMEALEKAKTAKEENKVIKQIAADCDEARDTIFEKFGETLDEIEEDKADDLKALKEGKGALAKVDDLDFDRVFSDAATAASKALATFKTKLEKEIANKKQAEADYEAELKEYNRQKELAKRSRKSGNDDDDNDDDIAVVGREPVFKWDDDKYQIALQFCEQELNGIRDEFKKKTDEGSEAIEYLKKIADKVVKNKDVSPSLVEYGKTIKALDKEIFSKWLNEVKGYNNSYDVAIKLLGKGDLKVETVNKVDKLIGTASSGEKTGTKVNKELKQLWKEFKQLEKDLK